MRRAASGRRSRVTAVADDAQTCAAIKDVVDSVSIGDTDQTVVRLGPPDLAPAISVLADTSTTVLARPVMLVKAGPGWFNRVKRCCLPWPLPTYAPG